MLQELKNDLARYANPEKAAFFPRIFKTGKGEANEGDAFLGITVPIAALLQKNTTSLHALTCLNF
jgi:hypothetical protein